MATITRIAPQLVIAGDSIEFLVGIPSDQAGWAGSARLTGPQNLASTTCATEGADYHVYFRGQTSPCTSDLPEGQYTLSVFATNGSDRKTIAKLGMTLTADLSAVDAPVLSHAARVLAIIEKAIEARLSATSDGAIESYSIDGRSVTKISTERLYTLWAKYAAMVRAEMNPTGPIGSVKFSFPMAGPGWPVYGPIDLRYRGLL